jgi:hypothetical protein
MRLRAAWSDCNLVADLDGSQTKEDNGRKSVLFGRDAAVIIDR